MDKYVACTTKKQWEAVLKKFDEDGYKWIVGNSVLSGLCYFNDYKSESVIHVHPDRKKLEFGNKDFYRKAGIKTFISAHDFLKGVKTKPIVISRNGRVVTAEDKNTGEKGVAICSPQDEFDFKIGAKLALARLFGEEIKPKFKVGDFVRTRKDAVAGERYENLTLNDGMITECTEIVRVEKRDYAPYVYVTKAGYTYTGSMLEKCEDDEIHEGDTVRITDTGKQYTTYNAWIKSNITDVDLICKFDYNRDASIDSEYVVVKIAEHGRHNKTLAYVKEKADLWPRCYLIDVKGLEKVTK